MLDAAFTLGVPASLHRQGARHPCTGVFMELLAAPSFLHRDTAVKSDNIEQM